MALEPVSTPVCSTQPPDRKTTNLWETGHIYSTSTLDQMTISIKPGRFFSAAQSPYIQLWLRLQAWIGSTTHDFQPARANASSAHLRCKWPAATQSIHWWPCESTSTCSLLVVHQTIHHQFICSPVPRQAHLPLLLGVYLQSNFDHCTLPLTSILLLQELLDECVEYKAVELTQGSIGGIDWQSHRFDLLIRNERLHPAEKKSGMV